MTRRKSENNRNQIEKSDSNLNRFGNWICILKLNWFTEQNSIFKD